MAKQPDQGWREWVLNNSLPKMEATSTAGAAGFTPAPANPQPFSGPMSLAPSFDVIELLPTAAADKLRMLRQRSADAHALIPEFEKIREASMARISAENALKRLTNHPQEGGFGLKEDHRSVIEAQRTLDKATADFRRLQELQEVRTAAWQSASAANAAVENWLKNGRPGGTTFEAVEVEPPKLNKNETVIDAVERLRRRCRELKADLHRIASAPFPSSHAKARMRSEIEALATRGAPSVSLLIEHDGEIIWPMRQVQVQVYNAQPGAVGYVEIPDTVAMDAWRHKSELIAALDAEINTEADDPAALSHEQRQQAEAETMGDLIDIERQEAALTWRAMDERLPIEFRGDCAPQAILGLKLVTTPRGETPGTSPEHAYNVVGGGRR